MAAACLSVILTEPDMDRASTSENRQRARAAASTNTSHTFDRSMQARRLVSRDVEDARSELTAGPIMQQPAIGTNEPIGLKAKRKPALRNDLGDEATEAECKAVCQCSAIGSLAEITSCFRK
jgi:hypothetical protein